MSITVNAGFDSGNIRLIAIEGDRVDLEIVKDHESDFYQWFHFRVAGAKGRKLSFRILNAAGAAYAFGWPGYRTRWSTDRAADCTGRISLLRCKKSSNHRGCDRLRQPQPISCFSR